MTDNFMKAKILFLRQLASSEHGACRHHLSPADRKNDKVRQSCRKDGLCVYESRGTGSRWFITDAGRAKLEALEAK